MLLQTGIHQCHVRNLTTQFNQRRAVDVDTRTAVAHVSPATESPQTVLRLAAGRRPFAVHVDGTLSRPSTEFAERVTAKGQETSRESLVQHVGVSRTSILR